MVPCRLLITGASGAGTTTLARAMADAWSVPHADVDDYFWVATSPPYTTKRPVDERLALMRAVFLPRDAWVLSGSVMGWGDGLVERLDAVVFLTVDSTTRLRRLADREVTRYGTSIEPGERNEVAHAAFIEWASGYDDPAFTGRSRVRHEEWLATLPCPVLRLDSGSPVRELQKHVDAWRP